MAQPLDDKPLIESFYQRFNNTFVYPSFDEEVTKSFDVASVEGVLARLVKVGRPSLKVFWDINKLQLEIITDSRKLERLYNAVREFVPLYTEGSASTSVAAAAARPQRNGALFQLRDDNRMTLGLALLLAFSREKRDIVDMPYLRDPPEPFIRRFEMFRRTVVAEWLYVTNDDMALTREKAVRFFCRKDLDDLLPSVHHDD